MGTYCPMNRKKNIGFVFEDFVPTEENLEQNMSVPTIERLEEQEEEEEKIPRIYNRAHYLRLIAKQKEEEKKQQIINNLISGIGFSFEDLVPKEEILEQNMFQNWTVPTEEEQEEEERQNIQPRLRFNTKRRREETENDTFSIQENLADLLPAEPPKEKNDLNLDALAFSRTVHVHFGEFEFTAEESCLKNCSTYMENILEGDSEAKHIHVSLPFLEQKDIQIFVEYFKIGK